LTLNINSPLLNLSSLLNSSLDTDFDLASTGDALATSYQKFHIRHHGTSVPATEARVAANRIRQYYTGKLYKLVLAGRPLSRFRHDLAQYLKPENEAIMRSHEFGGMIFRLPEFYDYDTKLEAMVHEIRANVGSWSSHDNRPRKNYECVLRPVQRLTSKQAQHYWMIEPDSGRLFMLPVDNTNSLAVLWETVWPRHELELQINIRPRIVDGIYHFKVESITGVKL